LAQRLAVAAAFSATFSGATSLALSAGTQDGKAAVVGSSSSPAVGAGSPAAAASSSGEPTEGEVAGKMVFGGSAAPRKVRECFPPAA
jgi:hypothetical protein